MKIGRRKCKKYKEKIESSRKRLFKKLRKSGKKLSNFGRKNNKEICLKRQIKIKEIHLKVKAPPEYTNRWIGMLSYTNK